MPVDLKPLGRNFLLYCQNSSKYAGILSDYRLVNARCQLRLRLDATLFISEIMATTGINKPKIRKQTPTEAAREYSLRIVIHGLLDDKETVGDLLSDAGYFLQHPHATDLMPTVDYDNPHYLCRPGAEMPKLEHLSLDSADDDHTQTEVGNEINKSRFLKIIETAEADAGAVTGVNTSPSSRLRSPLMRYNICFDLLWTRANASKLFRHQIIALAMMLEKESGYVEEPMFPSLWRKEVANDNKTVW